MRNTTLLITLLASLSANVSCVQTECGEGTIERDGVCQPADSITDPGICGPFTKPVGDRCVPIYQPTQCDPATSIEEPDPVTGVITCKGIGGGDCSTPIACPAPAGSTKLTVCGQIYDFETNAKFQTNPADPKPIPCDPAAPATAGPCALQILTFDALEFGKGMGGGAIAHGDILIDECGRYRVTDIETNGTGPYIALGFDDANMALGPAGVTVTTGVATAKPSERVVKGFEAWVVKASTAGKWQASGGPALTNGLYAAIFRAHKAGNGDQFLNQAGVTITKNGSAIPAQDHYFLAAQTTHETIDPAATATGVNGTGLLTGASVADLLAYAGTGGLGAHCKWDPHAAATLPGVVFFQVFRKADIPLDPTPCAD